MKKVRVKRIQNFIIGIAPAFIYIIPLSLIVLQFQDKILRQYLIFDVIGISFLLYTHIIWNLNKEHMLVQYNEIIRKFYFCYVYFFMILISPDVFNKQIIFLIGDLPSVLSTFLLVFMISALIYFCIFSNSHISEIAFGTTKVFMSKEKIEEGINEQIDLTESLLDKIGSEHKILQNLSSYSKEIYLSIIDKQNFEVSKIFENVLRDYFKNQKEDINVLVTDEINDLIKKKYSLSKKQFAELKYKMENSNNQLYIDMIHRSFYLLVLSFEYDEESDENVYIILTSESAFINEETYLILNILKEFYDKLLALINIETFKPDCYNLDEE